LEIWRDALESKDSKLIKTKIEYMQFKFSIDRNEDEGIVKLDGLEIPKVTFNI